MIMFNLHSKKPCAKSLVTLAVLMGLATTTAQAQVEEDVHLDDVSLQDLLDFDGMVVSASKKAESIDTAPAIMSVFTKQSIQDTGAKNIVEALALMTGIFTYDTYFSQYNLASMRNNFGGEHYLSKILFLINGHPVYSPVNGGAKLTALPIDAVERIEVVRGPVSVLFGTNALTGVINVITEKAGKVDSNKVKATIGSGSKHQLEFSIAQAQQDWRFYLSGDYIEEDGYPLTVTAEQDEAGRGFAEKDFGEDKWSLFANLGYKDFEADIFFADIAKDHKYGIIPNSFFAGVDTYDEQMFYVDMRYNHQLSDTVDLTYKFWYDSLKIDWRNDGIFILESGPFGLESPPHITDITTDSSKIGAEIFAHVQASEALDYSAGLVYTYYEADPYIFAIDKSIVATGYSPLSSFTEVKDDRDLAAYINGSYNLSETASLTAGLRYTENDTAGGQLNYRTGLIYKLSDSLILKGLYATSFRSANLFERYVLSSPILQGSEDLENEELEGFDIGLYYRSEKSRASINYYSNKTENFIKRRAVNGVPTYVNLPEGEKTTGLEYEFKYAFSKSLSMFVNGAHSFSAEDGATGDDLVFVVDDMVNFGVTYRPADNFTISSFNSYRSDWGKASAFTVAGLSMSYHTKLGDNEMSLSLTINNLFDKDYQYAEFSRGRLDTIPGGAPRRAYAAVSFEF